MDSVKVSVFEFAPRPQRVRRRDVLLEPDRHELEFEAVQVAFERETCSGCGSENLPLTRWPGSDTLSVASPAVETTLAVVEAS